MNIRFTTRARKVMVAVTVAAGLALTAVGCSGSEGGDGKASTSASASKGTGSDPSVQEGADESLAEVKGEDGLILKLTSATRDAGGFVTVSGELKNDGDKPARVSVRTAGDETEIIRHGSSLGGATLVDPAKKKRYYVLRDTDGRPLTTTNMPRIKAGASIPVFMQFPAPAVDTTKVTFQLPTFASATISISG
ncbi:Secreted protein OS=Streptomyces tendae OX=1932 GN=F3L20_04770 PE=4 SV=1 [Streptomyces tendae]